MNKKYYVARLDALYNEALNDIGARVKAAGTLNVRDLDPTAAEDGDSPKFTFYDRHDEPNLCTLLSINPDGAGELYLHGETDYGELFRVPVDHVLMTDVIHIADWLENTDEQVANS
jgi:hypothetical protein